MSLVLDTSVLLALLEADDRAHTRCVAMVETLHEDLVVPGAVLVELDYWLRKHRQAHVWRAFAEDLADRTYRLLHLNPEGVLRAAELETQYDDLGIGYVDASVIVTCENLDEKKVATLDRRHFSVVRPRHCDTLTLLPD